MSLLNMFSGGNWLTYFNTDYTVPLSRGTWSAPYTTFYSTGYSQVTSTSFSTNVSTGYIFTTDWTASRITSFDACVSIDSLIPNVGIAADVTVNTILELANEKFEPSTGVVTYSKEKTANGWRIVTEGGPSLVCSDSAPIQTNNGFYTPPELFGKMVAVLVNGKMSWSKVVECESIGQIQVQHITVGDRCFWAGETDAGYILHHNSKHVPVYTSYETSWVTSQSISTTYLSYFTTSNSFTTNWNVQTSNSTSLYYTTSWNSVYSVLTSRITGN